MDAIILAAGYAIRLQPLTEDTPKALLEVAGKPMMEHIVGKIEGLKIGKIYIVANDKFYQNFLDWLHNLNARVPVEVINDGTKSNEDRLGAVGDLNFIIKNKNIMEDIIVIAGDNLFELSSLL